MSRTQAFQTTCWSEIVAAGTQDASRRREALGEIAAQYWKPVYAYLRRRGLSPDQAEDLTQGFFEEIILERELVRRADRQRGRFRSFLLTALDRYVSSAWRAERARKRRPAGPLLSLEAADPRSMPEPSCGGTPEQIFFYTWAAQLLHEALSQTEAECRQAGQRKHWEAFRQIVLEPLLGNTDAPKSGQLCNDRGAERKTDLANMSVTVKRRFARVLRARVRAMVDTDAAVNQEIRELMGILSRGGAIS